MADKRIQDRCRKTSHATIYLLVPSCCQAGFSTWNEQDSVCYSESECTRRNSGSFYDSETGKCLTKVNEPCQYSKITSNPEAPIQMFPCVEGSSCPTVDGRYRSYCICNPGFTNTQDYRSCLPVRSLGEDCEDGTNLCNPREVSSCLNGTCVCGDGNAWDEERRHCVALAGKLCGQSSGGRQCTRNARCWSHNYQNYDYRYTCQCHWDQQQMRDGTCLAKYLKACGSSDHCVPGTECIDRVCMCPNPINSIFDEKKSQCFGLVGAKCGSNGTVASCLPNSECINEVCQCSEGYSRTFSRNCAILLDHGGNCSDAKTRCNFNQGLACINGRCDCVDTQLKYEAGKGCVGSVGSSCGMVKPVADCAADRVRGNDMTLNTCDHYFVHCNAESYCNNVGRGISGRCDPVVRALKYSDTNNTAGTLEA